MNDSSLKVLAIKTILVSTFGISTLPLLSVIVQYIDSITGFSSGGGYYTNSIDYIFHSPLVFIVIILCINIILSIVYLLYGFFKRKRGRSWWKNWYGVWRNGASGGSNESASDLSFTRADDTSYNISFTASVSGSYENAAKISADLGVTIGASQTYSLGAGYTVPVPQYAHYFIKYRPAYYTYTVVETKYKEHYNPSLGGMERYVVGTKTCYVNVFSNWDFTHVVN